MVAVQSHVYLLLPCALVHTPASAGCSLHPLLPAALPTAAPRACCLARLYSTRARCCQLLCLPHACAVAAHHVPAEHVLGQAVMSCHCRKN
jgi:hypothetical protein